MESAPADLLPLRLGSARLVGLDVGSKTVGVTVSDTRWMLATPLKTLPRDKFGTLVIALNALLKEYKIAAFVIGMPYNMDGSQGPRCQATYQFAQNLFEALGLPHAFWDERLSTVAAEQHLLEADVSRKKRQQVIDKMAARVILQGFLDHLETYSASS